jgi:hypothetical protein
VIEDCFCHPYRPNGAVVAARFAHSAARFSAAGSAEPKPANTEGAYNADKHLLFSECLFRAAASSFTPRGPKADSQSTRRSTTQSQNSQERRFPSSKAGMRVHVQIVRSL